MPFPSRTPCTLEERLKTALLNLRCSPLSSSLVFLLQTFKSFLSFASCRAAAEGPCTEGRGDGGATEPWYVLGIRHKENMWALLGLSHKSIRSGQGGRSADQVQGEVQLQHRCPAVTHKMLGTALVLGTYNWDATTAASWQRCDWLYGKGLPLESSNYAPLASSHPSILISLCLAVEVLICSSTFHPLKPTFWFEMWHPGKEEQEDVRKKC